MPFSLYPVKGFLKAFPFQLLLQTFPGDKNSWGGPLSLFLRGLRREGMPTKSRSLLEGTWGLQLGAQDIVADVLSGSSLDLDCVIRSKQTQAE